ncbi:MAG TPA: FHA domain-containing protein [Polyangiaceae bacterium]|nr:FHA domain-containing protein [Polyangiaceae bacterium]
MAVIQRNSDGRKIHIPHQLVIGRADSCDLILDVSSVSSHHAVIRWNGARWVLADLGSRNGTYVNGHRLAPRSAKLHPLSRGDEIAFAEREEVWTLSDDAAPNCLLVPVDDGLATITLVRGQSIAWPDENHAVALVFFQHEAWHVEDAEGSVQRLKDGETALLGDQSFMFHSPGPVPETPAAAAPIARRELVLAFVHVRVAPDEETAALRVDIGGEELPVAARSHLYLLAYLARMRKVTPTTADHGWVPVERACRDLQADPEGLAVLVYRCRKDFESLHFHDASRVIERTRGLLRIGLQENQVRIVGHDEKLVSSDFPFHFNA